MFEKDFAQRLAQLRTQKGISARDMSLSIGQNPGYINTIENGKAFPTMMNFFYICEFLDVTPQEFYHMSNQSPEKLHILMEQLKKLNPEQLNAISIIVNDLSDKS